MLIDVPFMTTPSVEVSASIHRIGEYVMDRSVRRRDPTDRVFHVPPHREEKAFGAEPKPDLADRSQFLEFPKDRVDGADHRFIGRETNFAVAFSPHKAHRQAVDAIRREPLCCEFLPRVARAGREVLPPP